MIELYGTPTCMSCRKVKKYFLDNGIKFVEKNIFQTKLTRENIHRMLQNSENGFEDIISTRSKIFKEKNVNFNEMSVCELVDFIIENPSILRRPIIVNEIDLQVGYNEDDISLFLPDDLRERECALCFGSEMNCNFVQELKRQAQEILKEEQK